jgi:hypothetical protein
MGVCAQLDGSEAIPTDRAQGLLVEETGRSQRRSESDDELKNC